MPLEIDGAAFQFDQFISGVSVNLGLVNHEGITHAFPVLLRSLGQALDLVRIEGPAHPPHGRIGLGDRRLLPKHGRRLVEPASVLQAFSVPSPSNRCIGWNFGNSLNGARSPESDATHFVYWLLAPTPRSRRRR
jgi:hypothetical protein